MFKSRKVLLTSITVIIIIILSFVGAKYNYSMDNTIALIVFLITGYNVTNVIQKMVKK